MERIAGQSKVQHDVTHRELPMSQNRGVDVSYSYTIATPCRKSSAKTMIRSLCKLRLVELFNYPGITEVEARKESLPKILQSSHAQYGQRLKAEKLAKTKY